MLPRRRFRALNNWPAGSALRSCLVPGDIDAYVLTGYSKRVQPSLPGVSFNLPAPAALVEPTRFPGKPLGYVTSTQEAALTNSFFGNPDFVDFDPAVASLFFQRRDTVSLGIVVTTYLPGFQPVAPEYKGRVLVLTGANDQAYCGLGSALLDPDNDCGSLLAETGSLFPAADYNYPAVGKIYSVEIIPTRVRAKVSAVELLANWMVNFAITLVAPLFLRASPSGPYFLFGGTTLFVALVCIRIPETNGRSLEAIESEFEEKSFWRRLTWRNPERDTPAEESARQPVELPTASDQTTAISHEK
ncbi:hypothetical protein PRZ48_007758 [Zasmidium cellare]|uniref:Major facilitator superfamily (MFS) profile domain-containing protein n=1 Tax=Zasmidium cellare TaxID=395010 RepID=A0ABR0EL55_ZASCE|nr:hypothetical protein PRZ48_007758 [Zasmidium cellare]